MQQTLFQGTWSAQTPSVPWKRICNFKTIERHLSHSLNSIMSYHSSVAFSEPSTHSSFRYRRCSRSFENRRNLYLHGMQEHYQVGSALQLHPWNNANTPLIREGEDQQQREIYNANAPLILEPHKLGPVFFLFITFL